MRIESSSRRQTASEADLVRAAQAGDAEAFGDLYRTHLTATYRYIYTRVGETAEAENLSQATFLKAWRGLGSYRPRQVPFQAWLYRIAHNVIVDYYRTRREPACCLEDLELVDAHSIPEDGFLARERQEQLRQALTRLKPSYAEVLTLRFLNGLDYAETARVLGQCVNNVRVLQFRALQALHAVLAEEGAQL